jgi:hypothetical protein
VKAKIMSDDQNRTPLDPNVEGKGGFIVLLIFLIGLPVVGLIFSWLTAPDSK